ncbi:LamG-like jellyroll fold domain-containing protein [Streptomyces sp. OK228]|uniref:LamG-like jellyroll fold domain-containing protein n=1 Tax=Streptomyces sp. OK228 TaxID=1882786 RepID=UPI000BE2CCF2
MRSSRTAWLAAAVLLVQPVGVTVALPAVAEAQNSGSSATTSLSPEAAASQKAEASGSAVEVVDDRTEYATTYANPDGTTFTLDQSTVPVRVRQHDGSWVSPDPTLDVRADGTVAPKAAVVDLAFSDGGDGSRLVDITRGGKSLRLGWPGTLPKPMLDGSSAVYTDVLPGVDLRMTATTEGFRELLVVKTPQAASDPALKKVAFQLQSDGLTVAPTSGGGMTAVDDNARPVFAAPPALMWDSQGDGTTGGTGTQLERTTAVTAASAPSPSATTAPSTGTQDDGTAGPGDGDASAVLPVQVSADSLAVVPDAGMLANSDSGAFPVYIDPSIGLDQTAHTYLRSDGVSDFNWGNGSNNEGKGMGHCSSYGGYYCGPGYTERLYFQFSPSNLAGKKVLSATFRATESWSFTCDARWVDLDRTSNISSSTTWSGRPSYLGTMASSNVSAGRSSACDPSQPPAPIEFSGSSLTSAAGDLAAGKFSRLTLMLKARDETDTSAWKRFRNDAVLSVTYVALPAVPTKAGIVEGSGISCETDSTDPDMIADPTPSLSATVWTATGGGSGASLRAHFYIQQKNSDGSWSVATEPVRPTSGYVGNGGVLTYPSPITLSEGTVYRLAVFSRSYYNSGASYLESHSTVTTKDWCYFKVDPTAPKAPTVTIGSPYSECTANACDPAGEPGVVGQFTFSPASGDTNTAYEYKLATATAWSPPISASAASKGVGITPQLAGTQQLQVRAEDSAGRWGAKTIVKFNVAEGQTAIGRWHFDDAAPGSGVTTAADTATEGARHAATLYTSGAGWSSLARRGDGDRSLWLNDTSDTTRQSGYAATAAPAVNTQSSFTVSAWAYLADGSDFRTVLSETGSDGSGFALYYSPGIQRWVFLWNWYENGVRKYLGANADVAGVPLKAWTHLTGVYDSKARTISLYVNGRMQGSPVALPSTSDATTTDGTLQFGRASFTPGSYVNYWRGRVDEVAVWQRVLTGDQIATEDQLLDSNGAASVELMGAWNPDGASGTTLADSTSGYGRTLTLSGGASLDGQAIVMNGTDGAATSPGPVVDDTASFSATTLVDVDRDALLTANKPVGYTAQVVGQRSADGSDWGFWYQKTGTDIDPDTDTTIPVGKWYFGRLNTDGSFTGVVSDEAAVLGSPVRMTGTYDAPSGTIHFYLGPDENDAGVTHPYTAAAGSGDFAAGEGYVGGAWGHYLPGKITDIRLWTGAMANQQQIIDTIGD